jgi:hypothetical protein
MLDVLRELRFATALDCLPQTRDAETGSKSGTEAHFLDEV